MFLKKCVLFVLCLILLFSCDSSKDSRVEKKSLILATINPYYLMAKEIAGDRMDIDLFIPPNASPHTYSPSPADLMKLEKAKLVIANGLGLETLILKKLGTLKERLFLAREMISSSELFEADHDHGEHNDEELHSGEEMADPHIWLNSGFLSHIAGGITERMIKIDPPGEKVYRKNLEVLEKSILETHEWIQKEREAFNHPGIMTFHNSFSYFLEEYKIEQIATIQESPGKDPTLKRLANIGEALKQHPLKVIYIEPQLNPKAARIIGKEFDLKIETLDPLGFHFKAKSVSDILKKNWELMAEYF